MSKEDNKHSDIARIKRAISRWQAKEKTKAEQKRLAEEEAERQRQVELQRQRDKNLSETGYSETDVERSYRVEKEDEEENARVQANVDKYIFIYGKNTKRYSKLFNLVFPSHKINTDKVSYHLFDNINWNFETKEKNGQYIAIKPCPEFCISSEENPKFLYNSIGIQPSTIYAKKNLEEYKCPYGVGYHLRTKSLNRKNI